MLLHQLVHLSTGNRQVFAPEHQSVFMHSLDLRFRRVHQGQRFETFRQVSRYRERYRKEKKNVQNYYYYYYNQFINSFKGGYAKFTGLKTYNKNLKTLLAIGGWNEGSSRFSPMVADPGRRREFVKNAIKFLRKNHFDGLDLDWEYPAFRDGGKPRDKDNYANLVQVGWTTD